MLRFFSCFLVFILLGFLGLEVEAANEIPLNFSYNNPTANELSQDELIRIFLKCSEETKLDISFFYDQYFSQKNLEITTLIPGRLYQVKLICPINGCPYSLNGGGLLILVEDDTG